MANAKPATGMPGWVKLIGAGLLVLLLLAAVMIALGHNPLAHMNHAAMPMPAGS
jgi:hypothetical protein